MCRLTQLCVACEKLELYAEKRLKSRIFLFYISEEIRVLSQIQEGLGRRGVEHKKCFSPMEQRL